MRTTKLLLALTVANFVLLLALLAHGFGLARAESGIAQAETVLLRLITERGRPSVKIAASEPASGLSRLRRCCSGSIAGSGGMQ